MAIYKTEKEVNGEQIIIHIEMDDSESDNGGLESMPSKLMETTHDVFGEGMKLARNCAVRVIEEVQEMNTDVCPDEFEIQLAVKLDSEIGAVLAKASAEAQMQIAMKWTRRGSLRPKRKWADEDDIPF